MSVEIYLRCDGCSEYESFGAVSVATTDKRALNAGWTVHDDQGHDYCPQCTQRRKAGAA